MTAVAVAGSLLTGCSSSTPEAFRPEPSLPGSVLAAEVVAEDVAFDPADATRPRFVPCQGLSGCARNSPATGDYYPGVVLPSPVDDEVDYAQQFVLYLVGATFEEATLQGTTVHIRVRPRARGFQMVKLDGRSVLPIIDPTFEFQDHDGTVLCTSMWEGCA